MGKQPLLGTVNATAKMIPEASRLIKYYQKEHDRLTLEFKQALKNLTSGESLTPNDLEAPGGDDSSSSSSCSEDSSSSHGTDGADNSSEDEHLKIPSEDEHSKIPLPPPADPDKPAAAADLAKRAKLGVRTNNVSKLKVKKPQAKSMEQGKESNINVDREQETTGIKTTQYTGLMRFLPPGSEIGMKYDGTVVNGESADGEKKERVRASKMEFKRLDELYVFQY